MTRLYTKTGDTGETGLYGGSRIGKDSLIVESYGNLDELNSMIGLAYASSCNENVKAALRQIQERLFVLGAELASDDHGIGMLYDRISPSDIAFLENQIDRFQETVLPQTSFVIPGGSQGSAAIHVARTIARRLERSMVRAAGTKKADEIISAYVNRLSDMLYILARAEEEDALIQSIKNRVLARLKMKKNNENKSLSFWKEMASVAEIKAGELGIGIVFAAVDQGGNLALLHRTDESLLASIDIAANKAYTALIMKMPSDKVGELALPGQMLYGIGTTNNNRIVTFGGGFPVERNGEIIGAIGVSGGTVKQDMEIAARALETIR